MEANGLKGNEPPASGSKSVSPVKAEWDTEAEPIAIVGMSCRFPGANNLEAFWQLLCHGVDAITEVPADRFDIDAIYDPRPGTPGKLCTRWGGFLEQIDQFDPLFFGISPREALQMDPQQRLLLEVAWEALEDAGQVPDWLAGSRSGVFIGSMYNDYHDLQLYHGNPMSIGIYTTTGGIRSVLAGRRGLPANFSPCLYGLESR
jgi:acyl transferase domain-containing protein